MLKKFKTHILLFFSALTVLVVLNLNHKLLPSGDEVHALVGAWSMAKDSDLDLKNQYDIDALFLRLPDRFIVKNGEIELPKLSILHSSYFYPIGKIVAAAGGKLEDFINFVKLQILLMWSIGALAIFNLFKKLKIDEPIAILMSLLYVAIYPISVYTSSASVDAVGSVLLLVGLNIALNFKKKSYHLQVALGIVLGLLIWMHPRFITIAIFTTIGVGYFSYKSGNLSSLYKVVGGIGIIFTCQFITNIVIYQPKDLLTIFSGPLASELSKSGSILVGINSLPKTLFDGWHGLIPVMPLSIVAFVGLARNYRSISLGNFLLIIIFALLVLSGSHVYWKGHAGFIGGRYHVIYMPFIWYGVGVYIAKICSEIKERGYKVDIVARLAVVFSLLVLQLIPSYYAIISDYFSGNGNPYGSVQQFFPNFYTDQLNQLNYIKLAFEICVVVLCALVLSSRNSLMNMVMVGVIGVLIITYIVGVAAKIKFLETNYVERVRVSKLIETKSEGVWSGDYNVKLNGAGYYNVTYFLDLKKISSDSTPGKFIGQCQIIKYLGYELQAFEPLPLVLKYNVNNGTNVLSDSFYHDGSGIVFFRCFISEVNSIIYLDSATFKRNY